MATLEFTPDKVAAIENVLADAWKNRASAKADEADDERQLSRAQRRMVARKKAVPDLVQPVVVTIDGEETETFYLRSQTHHDLLEIGSLMARERFGSTAISSIEAQDEFNIARLFVLLVVSETDETPYFETIEEAREFYDDPRNCRESVELVNIITARDPFSNTQKKINLPKAAS